MRTNIFFLSVFTTIFLLSMTDVLAKEEIYRWVDENGVVHFENKAPAQIEAEKVTIQSTRNTGIRPYTDAPDANTGEEIDSEASYAQQRRDERAKKRQAANEKEKMTAAGCENSRKVVAHLEPKTRVMVEQEDGTVIRMDDNDRLDRLGEEKAYIAKNCNK